jgi:hypothetical protein
MVKELIEGRIEAFAKVHTLFVESRWAGAELHRLATQELSAYSGEKEARVRIEGPVGYAGAEYVQSPCTRSRPTRQNMDRYRQRVVTLKSHGPLLPTGRLSLRWIESGGQTDAPPRTAGSAHAL